MDTTEQDERDRTLEMHLPASRAMMRRRRRPTRHMRALLRFLLLTVLFLPRCLGAVLGRFYATFRPPARPKHIIAYRPDPSQTVRFGVAMVALAVAMLLAWSSWQSMRLGDAQTLLPIGFGRLCTIAQLVPPWRPAVRWIVAGEQLIGAALALFVFRIFQRNFRPPPPEPGHQLIFYSRQAPQIRWWWLASGLMLVGMGIGLATVPDFQHLPVPLAAAGVLELLGLHRLGRFAWFAFVPAARSYLVVSIHPASLGLNNMLRIGDGDFARSTHEVSGFQLLDAHCDSSFFRRHLLGACWLGVTYDHPSRGQGTVWLDSPGTYEETQRLVSFLRSTFRTSISPSTLHGPFSGPRAIDRIF